jgi:FkbM family methyltransferase
LKYQVIDIFLANVCNPILSRICWGRKVPEGFEQWKHVSFSYSQFGEDLVIRAALQSISKWDQPMAYVDVGAFHPVKYSNTFLLYNSGWKGVNIDPNPVTVDLFTSHRPDDLNLHCGISSTLRQAYYHQPIKGEVHATGRLLDGEPYSLRQGGEGSVMKVPVCRLDEILDTYNWDGLQWGLLNIDTEGTEMQVLESNCWDRFRPLIISVEENHRNNSMIHPFLLEKGYRLLAECHLTRIFILTVPRGSGTIF